MTHSRSPPGRIVFGLQAPAKVPTFEIFIVANAFAIAYCCRLVSRNTVLEVNELEPIEISLHAKYPEKEHWFGTTLVGTVRRKYSRIENIAIPKIANPYMERNSEALCIFIKYQIHVYVE